MFASKDISSLEEYSVDDCDEKQLISKAGTSPSGLSYLQRKSLKRPGAMLNSTQTLPTLRTEADTAEGARAATLHSK